MNYLKKLLWWLIAGSSGGWNRARIIMLLKENPMNAHQISEALKIDYTTARHHLKILEKNKLVQKMGDRYGAMYFLSELLESNYSIFEEILEKIGKKVIKTDS